MAAPRRSRTQRIAERRSTGHTGDPKLDDQSREAGTLKLADLSGSPGSRAIGRAFYSGRLHVAGTQAGWIIVADETDVLIQFALGRTGQKGGKALLKPPRRAHASLLNTLAGLRSGPVELR